MLLGKLTQLGNSELLQDSKSQVSDRNSDSHCTKVAV